MGLRSTLQLYVTNSERSSKHPRVSWKRKQVALTIELWLWPSVLWVPERLIYTLRSHNAEMVQFLGISIHSLWTVFSQSSRQNAVFQQVRMADFLSLLNI